MHVCAVHGTGVTRKPVSMGNDNYVVFPRFGDKAGNRYSTTAVPSNSTLSKPYRSRTQRTNDTRSHPSIANIHEEINSNIHTESNCELPD